MSLCLVLYELWYVYLLTRTPLVAQVDLMLAFLLILKRLLVIEFCWSTCSGLTLPPRQSHSPSPLSLCLPSPLIVTAGSPNNLPQQLRVLAVDNTKRCLPFVLFNASKTSLYFGIHRRYVALIFEKNVLGVKPSQWFPLQEDGCVLTACLVWPSSRGCAGRPCWVCLVIPFPPSPLHLPYTASWVDYAVHTTLPSPRIQTGYSFVFSF